jgi:hypothetical protein
MRSFGVPPSNLNIPFPPDTVLTLLIAASSGQAMGWPSGVKTNLVRITGFTTLGAQMGGYLHLASANAAVPSSGQSTSNAAHPFVPSQVFQVPGGSTGFSVASLTSGFVHLECWSRAGST